MLALFSSRYRHPFVGVLVAQSRHSILCLVYTRRHQGVFFHSRLSVDNHRCSFVATLASVCHAFLCSVNLHVFFLFHPKKYYKLSQFVKILPSDIYSINYRV